MWRDSLSNVGPTSLEVGWNYPLPDPPSFLAYEVQLRQDSSGEDCAPPPPAPLPWSVARVRGAHHCAVQIHIHLRPLCSTGYTTYFGDEETFNFTGLMAATAYLFRIRYIENGIPSGTPISPRRGCLLR